MAWLPDSEKSLRKRVTVSTEYRRATDRQTSCDGIVRAMHMRRAVMTGQWTSAVATSFLLFRYILETSARLLLSSVLMCVFLYSLYSFVTERNHVLWRFYTTFTNSTDTKVY